MDTNENNNSNVPTTTDDRENREPVNTRQTSNTNADENNHRRRTRTSSLSMGSRVRKIISCNNSQEKLAKACCTCGIVCIAAGGGLILVYIMGMYTNFFGDLANLSALSVPGFCFFFVGLISAVFGIMFCWGCPQRSGRRGRMNERELNEAGFGLPGFADSNGYFNRGLVLDPPPAYNDILSSSTSSNSATVGCVIPMEEISVPSMEGTSYQHPPAYVDAVKAKSEKKSEDVQVETDDFAPPAYEERVSETSEQDC